ncbi:MAG: HD domain-containing protein [Candidatus Aenigmarchaeota archaeon]|nr:HD domain-containing protein [Candidatus Aenigmarchaeota archaeon]
MPQKTDILALYFHSKEELLKLPEDIGYHGWMHTKTFFDCVCYLAELEEIPKNKLVNLKVAALYHDRGYVDGAENHEEKSARIAREELPGFGYSEGQIKDIVPLILSTKIPTAPKDKLEMIMCDADLEALGRDYFPYVSELLRKESAKSEDEWKGIQIQFLKGHEYYTDSAKKLFNRQKQENLNSLIDTL